MINLYTRLIKKSPFSQPLQVRSTVQTREIDPQPRGPKGRLYPPLNVQHLVQFNLLNVPYGARLLEPQVGEFSWDRAPPEVVINAGDKQPGEINEGQQPDERNQHTNPTKLYILTMSQSSSTRRAIPGK